MDINGIESVKRHLSSSLFEKNAHPETVISGYPFVTISREAGAGGHSVAEALLKKMEERRAPLWRDWRIFDRELCEKVAEDPDIRVSLEALLDERFQSSWEEMLTQMVSHVSPQYKIYKKLFWSIRGLASLGKAVIVGRGSVCLTRNQPGGIHVRLIASRRTRAHRMAERLKVGRQEAEQYINRQEKDRAKLVRNYFHADIANPLLYDAVWNTDFMGYDEVASAILAILEERAQKTLRPVSAGNGRA